METQLDCLWILALVSRTKSITSQNMVLIILLIFLAWLGLVLCNWSYHGGPAWGRYYRTNGGTKYKRKLVIPGPSGFPVFGSMNLMAGLAHHKLATAASLFKAKKLMAFSMGETRVIITSHPEVAKEILNSSVFANRPVKESAYSLMFNRAIGFAPYGTYWRTLRRIAATHMFSPKQISAMESHRSDIASQMAYLMGCHDHGTVRVRDIVKRASLNSMMCSVFGKKYQLGSLDSESEELKGLVEEGYELLGKLNWSDHLPWLASLDLQKIRFRCSKLVPRVNRFLNRIIEEHREQSNQRRSHNFVDVLLTLHGPDKLSGDDMVAVLWEMIFRGTDTVAVLIEWILARMVLHPEVQSKVHQELDQVVGRSRPLMESDIQSTVYLQAIIKEGLRLHPPGPLLSWARLAIADTTVDGYDVPGGTIAMVNMWAITRDPQIWEDPLRFMPDRFLSKEKGSVDLDFSVLGSDLRLAPFGSGRRTCPGKALGLATVSFWIGTLLHEFEWVQVDHDPVDLSEVLKLSCEMANPLVAKVNPRRIFTQI